MAITDLVLPAAAAKVAVDRITPDRNVQLFKLAVGPEGQLVLLTVGAGDVDEGTPRFTLASDDPAVAALVAMGGEIATEERQIEHGVVLGQIAESLAVLESASESSLPSQVVGRTAIGTATPTVSSSPAYVSGECIGGKLTFVDMAREVGLTGLIHSAVIHSKSAQTFACELIVFHTNPAATTFTDNAALSVNAADFDKIACRIAFASTDWSSLGTPSVAEVSGLGKIYKAAVDSTTLYGILVARGAVTLGSTSDIKVAVKAMLD